MASNPPCELEAEAKSKPRPLMLKDFLREDQNSWSNDFPSFPGRSCTTVRKLLEIDLNSGDAVRERGLSRRRSKTTRTISAFQKASEAVINAVRHFPFSSGRSPPKQGTLPRSLSQTLRRSFRRKKEKERHEIRGRTSAQDIIRWKSFREAETKKELQAPCSISSSCAERDYALDFLLSSSASSYCSGENEGKKHLPERTFVGEDSVETATCHGEAKVKHWKGDESRGELECSYEKEQLSPVSVLDFPYEDEEIGTPSSSFEDSLASMERTTQQLLQKIRRFECLARMEPVDLEKRIAQSELNEGTEHVKQEDEARNLLQLFKECAGESGTRKAEKLLVDFFREGLASSQRSLLWRGPPKARESEDELLRAARDWTNGYVGLEWGLEDNREACVREMEGDERWRSFKEEKAELAMEMESEVVGPLVEELLLDLLD